MNPPVHASAPGTPTSPSAPPPSRERRQPAGFQHLRPYIRSTRTPRTAPAFRPSTILPILLILSEKFPTALRLPAPLRLISSFIVLATLILTPACKPSASSPSGSSASSGSSTAASPVAQYTYSVVATYPHDPQAFTQGLQYLGNGLLLEGTGQPGHSSLRRVDLTTGNVLKRVNLPAPYFGEGITFLGDRIYQLTWQHQKGFIYDLATLSPIRDFTYTGEGWGLTTDGHSLILSDGTATIRFLNPETFAVTRTIDVTLDGRPIPRLNELEFIDGEIVANIWQTHSIVRIDPTTGRVTAVIDLAGILPAAQRTPDTDVLNGIAYDSATKRLFVTGKNWPRLFEIKLIPKSP